MSAEETARGLILEDLRITIGGAPFLDLSARIAPGEALTVMGPSGSGKSTLLSAIIGSMAPGFGVSGRIILNRRDISAAPTPLRRVGILFQDDMLFPHLSVGGNLGFGLSPAIRPRAARRRRIEAALAGFGLEGFADRDPATLSGGQKARVALLRMLLSEPEALLLDEPFSKLDAALRTQIRDLVFAEARARGLPVLLVTHDEADAAAAGGRMIALGRG